MTAAHFLWDDLSSDTIVLSGEEGVHAARALRVKPGEPVTVGDGRGAVASGHVAKVVGSHVTIDVEGRRVTERVAPAVRACPAVPKGGKLDLVVQKLTELGVDRISPWVAERTVVKWNDEKRRAHSERYRQIARSAAKQARSAWLPIIDDATDEPPFDPPTLVFHEEASVRAREVLPDPGSDLPAVFTLVTGPEGGLSTDETAKAEARGAHIVTLGEQVFRAETASILASALVLTWFYRLG